MKKYRLSTEDLRSKWGFEDGDIFDDLLWEHREELGTYTTADDMTYHLTRPHEVLARVVEKYMLPELLVRIGTCHNPIRYADEYCEPKWFSITEEQVLEIAREVWAERGCAGRPKPLHI